MLQYFIVLLDDTSVSYCHYDNKDSKRNLIDIDILKKSLVWAMKENLNVQFVYPNYELPEQYDDVIESVDNTKIKGTDVDADVIVLKNWLDSGCEIKDNAVYIIKATRNELRTHIEYIKKLLSHAARVNVIVDDILDFVDDDIIAYEDFLEELSSVIVPEFEKGRAVQCNLLTDRIMLDEMNNCDAGVKSITLAPNGKFYLCPAFYYENSNNSLGDYSVGLTIKNPQLLQLDHAPLCRMCDAYQCKRCIWMNIHSTLDVNTPSHQQCVISHIERNASEKLLCQLKDKGISLNGIVEIKKIDYLDPYNKFNRWK